MVVKQIIMGGLIAAGLLAIPAVPAVAQSIDIGPGGVRVDPRSPREREDDAIRREERRDAIRREERRHEFDEDGPPPPRRDRY